MAALALVAACRDPLMPGSGVATQDDVVAGDVVMVSAGESHTCVLRGGGVAWCWGSNEFGQLGFPQDSMTCPRDGRRIPCAIRPRAVETTLRFLSISAGGDHTCALGVDHRAYCWGDNLYGQLGDPAVRFTVTPLPVASAAAFIDVAAGGQHSCGVRTDGVVMCWGANEDGQLGTSSTGAGASVPVTAQTQQRFATLSAGLRRTCARATDGFAYCWGATWVERNNSVEVVRPQAQPLKITQVGAIEAVTAGMNTTCAIDRLGAPWCWQANPTGTIGDGTTSGSTAPMAVSTTRAFVAVSSGRAHVCAVDADALAWCWGENTFGQLGMSPAYVSTRCGRAGIACMTVPARVSGWRRFAQVSAGHGDHSCGVTLAASVYCWGAGFLGQRGDGRRTAEWSPVRVPLPM